MLVFTKRLSYIMAAIAALLLVPFIAMFFTTEVNWSLFDFVVAAGLLSVAGLGLECMLQLTRNKKRRWIYAIALFIALVLLWAELAVGIFNSPIAGS